MFEQARALLEPLTDKPKKIRCPSWDHEDKHPSALLYPDGFHCFSCGAHGDSVDYFALIEGLSLSEALRRLGVSGDFTPVRKPSVPPWATTLAHGLAQHGTLAPELAIAETLSVDPDGFYVLLAQHPEAFCRAVAKRGLEPLAVYDLIELIFSAAGDPFQTREVF